MEVLLTSKKVQPEVVFHFEEEKLKFDSLGKHDFTGKAGQLFLDRKEKVMHVGLGKEKEFELDQLRQSAGAGANALKNLGVEELSIVIPEVKESTRACVEGALVALYDFNKYKTDNEAKKEVKKLFFRNAGQKEFEKALAVGTSVNYVRSINNEPANIATPEHIAEEARKLARENGLKCSVWEESDLVKKGYNGIASVSAGSKHRGKMIVLEYDGTGDFYCIVGKGITFDSGGISIKPSEDMDKMKYDKSGACAVLGIMKAASELKLKKKIVGIMCMAENVPSGSAYKPGDIITTGGKSIEVLNTDAEGRVVLADGLSYATTLKPKGIIDLATLTGACVVALGDLASGLMGNDKELVSKLFDAGMKSGERNWELPMWKEYDDKIKSDFADVKNIGDRGSGGTITAACFLKKFVGDSKWAHLDIAGTAWNTKARPYLALGATGVGVKTIIEFLGN